MARRGFQLFAPKEPTAGVRTWSDPLAQGYSQRGQPSPLDRAQSRQAAGAGLVQTPQFGGTVNKVTPYYSRGAAAEVVTLGKVLTNPIGAGVLVRNRIKPQNSKPGNYEAGAIFWTAQSVPTNVKLTGLTDPQALAAVLGPNYVKAAVRVNG